MSDSRPQRPKMTDEVEEEEEAVIIVIAKL